jgi:hypothetical protein
MERDQYKGPRQPRLRYLFEAIERAKRSALSEDIEIKSTLTIEHIMPQAWSTNWPIPGFDHLEPGEFDPEFAARQAARSAAVNKLGNLTLLTQALNSSVSNGPYSVKMPAVRSNSSLALNRDLNGLTLGTRKPSLSEAQHFSTWHARYGWLHRATATS